MRIATAFATGAAAMYFLDPVAGNRRRALVRDKGVAARHDVEQFARAKSKRAVDKVHGVVAETRSTLAAAPVGDAQLRERIRTRLGRMVDRPGDIEVDVLAGQVALRGTASAEEIDDVLETVAAMRGVTAIDNHLVQTSEAGRDDGAVRPYGNGITATADSTSPSTP
ncbi:MAG TPA: BON domain-containing protein [Xanthomonadaceae bacterium]|nr:BON domain-containing protein [Xanthomonadaceae bacterium]